MSGHAYPARRNYLALKQNPFFKKKGGCQLAPDPNWPKSRMAKFLYSAISLLKEMERAYLQGIAAWDEGMVDMGYPTADALGQERRRMTEMAGRIRLRQAMALTRELEIEALGDNGLRWTYLIGIRPPSTVTRCELVETTRDFLARCAQLREYWYAFEQKEQDATSATLGRGMHVHIVVNVPERCQKGQLVDCAWRSFKHLCDKSFVDVRRVKNMTGEELALHYLLTYQSKDGHKALTQLADAAWREREGLHAMWHGGPDADAEGPVDAPPAQGSAGGTDDAPPPA